MITLTSGDLWVTALLIFAANTVVIGSVVVIAVRPLLTTSPATEADEPVVEPPTAVIPMADVATDRIYLPRHGKAVAR